MLLDLTQAPDSDTLSQFLARLPLVFRVVILSPHGYFGQQGVLGMPDTGGQVRKRFWSRARQGGVSWQQDYDLPGKVGSGHFTIVPASLYLYCFPPRSVRRLMVVNVLLPSPFLLRIEVIVLRILQASCRCLLLSHLSAWSVLS